MGEKVLWELEEEEEQEIKILETKVFLLHSPPSAQNREE